MQRLTSFTLLLVCLVVPAAAAQETFEAVVSGAYAPQTCNIVPIVTPALQWFNPDRVELDVTSRVQRIASPDHQRVYGLLTTNPVTIVALSPSGARTPFFTGLAGTPAAITAARDGRVFVHYSQGGERLAVISAAGALETTYALPGAIAGGPIDVASDGCIIYYTSATGTSRLNGCTGAPLGDFSAAAGSDIDVMPDGSAMLVDGDDLELYDAGGVFLRTIANVTAHGLPATYSAGQADLSPDGQRVYLTVRGQCGDEPAYLLILDFSNGAEISRRELTMTSTFGVVAGLNAATVPTLSELAVMVFAALMGVVAVVVLRR